MKNAMNQRWNVAKLCGAGILIAAAAGMTTTAVSGGSETKVIAREATQAAAPTEGRLIVSDVHFEALEGNLLGDPTERSVTIYLPPSYDADPERRFPVVYLLHGVGDTDVRWRVNTNPWRSIESIMNLGIDAGSFGEMIVIMPQCTTSFLAGMYTDSPVHGKLATYITEELVTYIDTNYRTIADREHRGVAGHSMGGHGAIKLGITHPEVYSVVYGMNPAALGWAEDISYENLAFDWASKITTIEELWQPGKFNFWNVAILSGGQSWSPDLDNPPFYANLPFVQDRRVPHLVPNEPAHSQWEANMPLYMVEREDIQANIRMLTGLRFDSAFVDEFAHIPPTSRALSERLTELGLPHVFEMYNGNHRRQLNGPEGRLHTELFPYFSRLLGAE